MSADDTGLISESPDGLEKLVESVKRNRETNNLLLNPKILRLWSWIESKAPLQTHMGAARNIMKHLIYLEVRIHADGKATLEIIRRLAIATTKQNQTKRLQKSQDLNMNIKMPKNAYFRQQCMAVKHGH